MQSSHPYEQPSITVILILSGFLILLNVVNKLLDSILYCGLVGQVFVGILFGTPGANLLNDTVETSVSNLGYLGLVLLVYEGGLSTSLSSLISSFILSLLVAVTGILLPIALSFLLIPLGASPLQCFSAGASLSATSLGTAFATLSSSGLLNTDVGTVLTSAAMLDDVIGLVMLQVVTELSTGQGTAREYGKTIGRALGASVGLVLIVVIICRLIIRPLYKPTASWLWSPKRSRLLKSILDGVYLSLVVQTAILLILVVAGSYAGTSTLLAAFIAGTVVRWWGDALVPNQVGDGTFNDEEIEHRVTPAGRKTPQTGLQIYEQFYGLSTRQILKPFFFASIGFSIPITQMFQATTVWKGLVFALLMFLAKMATGLWLVPSTFGSKTPVRWFWKRQSGEKRKPEATVEHTPTPNAEIVNNTLQISESKPCVLSPFALTREDLKVAETKSSGLDATERARDNPNPELRTPERRGLRAYSPALLGLAMGARGEIGFLIASVAESHGIFSSSPSSELYLVVVWAIVLCTIIGPVTVGSLVRRIKRLEAQGQE